MKKRIVLIFISFLLCYASKAQWTPKDTLHDFCRLCLGEQHLIGQPYNNSFKKEWPFVLSSAAIFSTGIIMGETDKTKPFTEEQLSGLDAGKLNALDRPTIKNWSPGAQQISNYTLYAITLLPVLFLAEHHTAHDFKSLAVMSLEVFAMNYGTTFILKNAVNRTRPYVYNDSLPLSVRTDKESRKSYYSGHTSQTAAASFFFAKVIFDYHPDLRPGIKIGIWTFAATVPALEAYFRVKGGKHYPTDVITGYVLGALSGFIIPELHRNFSYVHPSKKEIFNMGFGPVKGGVGMNMSLRF